MIQRRETKMVTGMKQLFCEESTKGDTFEV